MSKQFNAYLFFDGNCAQALGFYEKTLGGKTQIMTHGQIPPGEAQEAPGPELKDRVMHGHLALDDGSVLMASDTMPGEDSKGVHGVAITVSYPSTDEAKKIFDALADGGKVAMPLGKTFWAELFGMLTDKFGVTWFVSGGQQMGG